MRWQADPDERAWALMKEREWIGCVIHNSEGYWLWATAISEYEEHIDSTKFPTAWGAMSALLKTVSTRKGA